MVVFLQKDNELYKIYSARDGNRIVFERKNGPSFYVFRSNYQTKYEKMLADGFVDVTSKYFVYLVNTSGNYCIIEDIYLDGRRFAIKTNVGAESTCGPETAKRKYDEKIKEGYVDATKLYDNYCKDQNTIHYGSSGKQEDKYMYGLDYLIDPIPLPDYYKETIFSHFKK